MNKHTERIAYLATGLVAVSPLLLAGVAFAQAPQGSSGQGDGHGRGDFMRNHTPGVFGTVSAINGSTLTIDSKGFGKNTTQTTYSVDASNATVTKDQATSSVSAIATGDMVLVEGTVNGSSISATSIRDGMKGGGGSMGGWRGSGVMGTVTALDGSIITLQSKGYGQNASQTTYTVNAANATVMKNAATSTLAAIAVGDRLMVQGTTSGTTVTATMIRDGVPQRNGANASGTPIVQGNGQPVVGGTITAINGSSLTVTNKSNVTYTIDASNATVEKGGAASSVSALAVGDMVLIQGTVNGSSVTASSVIDSKAAPQTTNSQSTSGKVNNGDHRGGFGGFLGGIGGFFHELFGFF